MLPPVRTLLRLLVLLVLPVGLGAQGTVVPPLTWADSAAVLTAVLDSVEKPTRPMPALIALRSCARLRPPCAVYGGWSSDSAQAVALLSARGSRRAPAGFGGADSVEVVTLGAPVFRGRDSASVFVSFRHGPGPYPGHGVIADFHALVVRDTTGWRFVYWRMTRIT